MLPDVVQTSAPINPGNSGGALVDLQGQVVGIPTPGRHGSRGWAAALRPGSGSSQLMLPDIAGQIIRYGHVVDSHRAFLGVKLATAPANGVAVASVQPGGPAARAGIVAGDLITSIDGQPITAPGDVAAVLATLAPGSTATVGVTRPHGSSTTVKVTLGQYPGT